MDINSILDKIEEELFEEKFRGTPEEKSRQQKTLKELDYDPKTKTISDKTGGRIKLNIDRYNTSSAHTKTDFTTQKNLDKQQKVEDLRSKKRYAKVEPNEFGKVPEVGGNIITSRLPKKIDPKTGKVSIDRVALAKMKNSATKAAMKSIENEGNAKHARAHSITLNQKDLQDDTKALHELGEVNNKKKQRQIARGVDNKNTRAYQAAKDAAQKAVKKNALKLNKHDRNADEILADQFVKKHSKYSDADDRLNGRIHQDHIEAGKKYRREAEKDRQEIKKDLKEVRDKAFLRDSLAYATAAGASGVTDSLYKGAKAASKIKQKRDIKSADTRRDIGNKTYNQKNSAAFERVIDLILESTDMDVSYAERLYSKAYEKYIKE